MADNAKSLRQEEAGETLTEGKRVIKGSGFRTRGRQCVLAGQQLPWQQ